LTDIPANANKLPCNGVGSFNDEMGASAKHMLLSSGKSGSFNDKLSLAAIATVSAKNGKSGHG
jgi:hypothetical protein